jgi:hypothetical protein
MMQFQRLTLGSEGYDAATEPLLQKLQRVTADEWAAFSENLTALVDELDTLFSGHSPIRQNKDAIKVFVRENSTARPLSRGTVADSLTAILCTCQNSALGDMRLRIGTGKSRDADQVFPLLAVGRVTPGKVLQIHATSER